MKEIEEALLNGEADLAVHSMKDVPMELPQGLLLGCVPPREKSTDCLLSCQYGSVAALPQNACVGTSSLRRQAQLLAQRPDLRIESLRGNVDTRLRKLREGVYDAIVLASAGLNRLELTAPCMHSLDPQVFFLPLVRALWALNAVRTITTFLPFWRNWKTPPPAYASKLNGVFWPGLKADVRCPWRACTSA